MRTIETVRRSNRICLIHRTLLIGTALAGTCAVAVPAAAQSVPVVATNGGATVTYFDSDGDPTATAVGATLMDVDLANRNRVINYTSYNLGPGATVNYHDGAAGATPLTVINRVTGALFSSIEGTIQTDPADNIHVFLINPNGILFGATGSFSGTSLALSTLPLVNIADFDGTPGDLSATAIRFADTVAPSTAGITLTAGDDSAGQLIDATNSILVVGQKIDAGKTLSASGGSVVLVAATDVTFSNGIGSPLSFTINAGTKIASAQVDASGTIAAGSVRLAGGAANAVSAALLNVDSDASLTATAAGGSVILATASTPGVTITNGAGITPNIASAGSLSATAAGGTVQVVSAGNATVAGAVAAEGAYSVTGRAVTLGATGATVTQASTGAVTITASNGAIAGLGQLTLRSNSDGIGTEALSLSAAGNIDFLEGSGPGANLSGGIARNSLVKVDSGGTFEAQSIDALGLVSGGGGALTVPGAVTVRSLAVDDSLDLTTTNGTITIDSGQVRGSGSSLFLAAGGGTSDVVSATALRTNGGNIVLNASRNISLAAAATSLTGTPASGSLTAFAGNDITASGLLNGAVYVGLSAGRDVSAASATAGDTVLVLSGRDTSASGTLTAGQDIAVQAGGDIALASLNAGDDIQLTASGTVALATASATGAGGDATEAGFPGPAGAPGSLSIGAETRFGSNVVIDAAGAASVSGAVSSSQDYLVSGSTVTLGTSAVTVSQTAKGAVTVTADTGAIAGLGQLMLQSNSDATGAETLTLDAANGAVDFLQGAGTGASLLGGTATQRSLVKVRSAGTFEAQSVDAVGLEAVAGGALTVPGAVTVRSLLVDQALDLSTTAGTITIGSGRVRNTGQTLSLTAGGAGSDIVSATELRTNGGDITLTAADNIQLATVLTALSGTPASGRLQAYAATDISSSGAMTAGGDILLSSGRDVSVAATTAGLSIGILAGRDVDASGTLTGAEDVAVQATGGISAATLSAGNDIVLTGGGAIGIAGATASGAYPDASDVTFAGAPGAAGSITFGADTLTGSNVVIDATGGASVSGAVSSDQDYLVTGSTVILGTSAATVSQAAAGAVTITANTGGITGLGRLTLQANSDAAGAEALTLDAAGGNVDFLEGAGPGANLLGGTAADRSLVKVRGGGTLEAQSVDALGLEAIAGGALTVPGAVTVRSLLVDQALDLRTTNGSITVDSGSVRNAGADLSLTAGGAGSDIVSATELRTNGGNLTLTAGDDITVATVSTALAGAPTAGYLSIYAGHDLTASGALMAKSDLLLSSGHDVSLATASTGLTLAILAGNDIEASGTLAAGEDLAMKSGHDITLSATVTAGDDIDLNAVETITLGDAYTTGSPLDARSVTWPGPAGAPGSIGFAAETLAGSNIRLVASEVVGTSSPIPPTEDGLILGNLTSASFDLDADAGDVRIGSLTATGPGGIAIDAGGSVTGAGGFTPLSGGSVVTTPGELQLHVTGDALFQSITAGGGITIATVPDRLLIGTISGSSLNLTAVRTLRIDNGTITNATILRTTGGTANPATSLTGDPLAGVYGHANLTANVGSISVGALSGVGQLGVLRAGDDIDAGADALDVLDARATGGYLSLVAESGRLTLGTGSAGTDATLVKRDDDGVHPAADVLEVTGSLTAGGNVAIRSETGADIAVAKATTGNLTANAHGNLVVTDGRAGRSLLALAGGTFDSTTLQAGEDFAGRSGGAATIGNVAAGDNLGFQAGGRLQITSASTSGAGVDNNAYSFNLGLSGQDGAITSTLGAINGSVALRGADVRFDTITSALGNVAITATGGDISGVAGVSGAGALIPGWTRGTVTANGPTSSIRVEALTGNVQLGALTAGAAAAPRFGSPDQIYVQARGIDISTATAKNGDLVLFATNGPLSLVTGSAAGDAALDKRGATGVLQVTNRLDAGGSIALSSGYQNPLPADPAARTITDLQAGTITAGADVSIYSTGEATLGTVSATGSVAALTGGLASIASVTAGEDIAIKAGSVTLTAASAGDDLDVTASGAIDIGTAETLGTGTDASAVIFGANTIGFSFAAADVAAQARSNLILNGVSVTADALTAANSAAVLAGGLANLAEVTAGEDIAVNGGTVSLTTATAGDDIDVIAAGALTVGTAETRGTGPDASNVQFGVGTIAFSSSEADVAAQQRSNLTLNGGSVAADTLTAASTVAVLSAGLASITDASAGEDIAVKAATVELATATAGDDIEVTATGVIKVGTAEARGTGVDGSAVRFGSGTITFVTAPADVEAQQRSNLTLNGGSVAADTLTAANTVAVLSVGSATIGQVTAGEDIAVKGGTVSLTTASAGDDIDVTASGELRVGTAETLGTGPDVSSVQFGAGAVGISSASADAQRRSNLTLNGGTVAADTLAAANTVAVLSGGSATIAEVTAGEDIAIKAATVSLTTASAGDDIDVTASGSLNIGTAETLGTGPDVSSVQFGAGTLGISSADVAGQRRSNLTLNAGSVTANTLAAANTVAVLSGGSATIGKATAGEDIAVNASSVALTAASAGDDIDLAASGALSVGTAQTLGTGPDGSAVRFGTGTVGISTATADVAGQKRSNLTLNGRSVAASTLTAANTVAVLSGSSATIGKATAGEDIAVKAGRISLTSASAGDDIDLTASGALSVGTAQTLGSGPDGSAVRFGTGIVGISSADADAAAQQRSNLTLAGDTINVDKLTAKATLAVASAHDITASGALAAGEDLALSAGGDVSATTLKAGDDLDLQAGGTAYLVRGETTGSGSDDRAVGFAPAITRSGAAADGSNIRIAANALTGPGYAPPADPGLIVGTMTAGSFDLDAAADARLGSLTATGTGGIDVAARGSVTGLPAGGITTSGGVTLVSAGNVILGVGTLIAADNIAASGSISNTLTDIIRVRELSGGSVGLHGASSLFIQDGTVAGQADLDTASGSIASISRTATPLAPNFGRANLEAAANAGSVLVNARTGVAQLGAVRAGSNLSVTADALDVVSASSRAGNVRLAADAGIATIGSASGVDIAVSATGNASVTGAVAARRDYAVTGRTVTLGKAAQSVTQAAGGAVTITATAGSIAGLGQLTLQSNSDGAGAEAMTLSATGNVDFLNGAGPGAILYGGQPGGSSANRSLIEVSTGGTFEAQTINALGLVSTSGETLAIPGSATIASLTVPGAVTIDSLSLDQALYLRTTAGTIALRSGQVRGNGSALVLAAGGTGSDILSTTELRTNGGDLLLTAGRDVSLAMASTSLAGSPGGGTLAAYAGRDVAASGTLAAGEDLALKAAGTITLTTVTAGDDILLPVTGNVTLNSATTTGAGPSNRTVTFPGAAGAAGSIGFVAETGTGPQILLETSGDLALSGAINASSNGTIIVRNTGGADATTAVGSASGTLNISDAELNNLNAGTVIIDSGAHPLGLGAFTIDGDTGSTMLQLTGRDTISITGAINGSGTGTLAIGEGALDSNSLVDEASLTPFITLNSDSGSITFSNGTVDLRASRILFGNTAFLNAAPGSDAAAAENVANSASPLYIGDSSNKTFLSARLLKVAYSNFAHFQNTFGTLGGGVALNSSGADTALALQLFSAGDGKTDSFALFGRVNGKVSRTAGLLPNGQVEIRNPGSFLLRVTQANSRVNGCVIGSPDRGCLVIESAPPRFNLFDERQAGLLSAPDDGDIVNPLVGRGNEGLIVDIADAPVGIDVIDCPENDSTCEREDEQ